VVAILRGKNIFSAITEIFILLLLTVFLFYCGSGGYQDILTEKYHAFLWICCGYIVVMGILAVELLLVGAVRAKPLRTVLHNTSWVQRLAILYMLLTWLSALCSSYFPQTIIGVSRYEGALTISIYCACFLLVSATGKVTKRMLWSLGLAAFAFGVICIVQLAGCNPFTLYPSGYNYFGAYTDYAGAYLGTIGNVDLVSAFLCIVIPILWIGMVYLRGKVRFLLAVPLAISLYVLIRMSVLAGIVGVFVGGLVSLLAALPIGGRKKSLFALGVLAAAFLFVYAADIGGGMLHEAHEILHGNISDDFGSGRIHIWKEVLAQIPQHFFLGAGPDTMAYANLESFVQYHDELGATIVSQIDAAHNEYLNILYHQGIFSFAAYVLFLGANAKNWRKRTSSDPVAAMLGGAALAYCIQAFFSISMFITAPFFWTTLALLESQSRKDGKTT
jgi:O-antigen ligase